MKRLIEQSPDQLTTHTSLEFEKTDNPQNVTTLINESRQQPNRRLEYSTDNGFSWVPLRMDSNPVIGARVIDLINKNHLVRILELTDAKDQRVTQSEEARESSSKQIIFRTADGTIDFGPTYRGVDRVAEIENTNVYKMAVPNRTKILWTESTGKVGSASDLPHLSGLLRGFVYRTEHASSASMAGELSKLSMWDGPVTSQDFIHIEAARYYDEELFKLVGHIPAATILNGKYQVTNQNYSKLGGTWIIKESDLPEFYNVITGVGGVVNGLRLDTREFSLYKKGLAKDTNEIMQMHRVLQACLDQHKRADALSEELALAIQYRDQVVDSIISLNQTIKLAQAKLAESIADETLATIEATPKRS